MVSYDLLLFMSKIETPTGGTNSMPFLLFRQDIPAGLFAVYIGDHLTLVPEAFFLFSFGNLRREALIEAPSREKKKASGRDR